MTEITVAWYESLHEMFKGVEKNSFGPSANYSWLRLIMVILLITAIALAPFTAVAMVIINQSVIFLGIFLVFLTTMLFFGCMDYHKGNGGVWTYLCLPVGFLLLETMFLRAAWLCTRNNGIHWRGTHYSEKELKAGQRVKFQVNSL